MFSSVNSDGYKKAVHVEGVRLFDACSASREDYLSNIKILIFLLRKSPFFDAHC